MLVICTREVDETDLPLAASCPLPCLATPALTPWCPVTQPRSTITFFHLRELSVVLQVSVHPGASLSSDLSRLALLVEDPRDQDADKDEQEGTQGRHGRECDPQAHSLPTVGVSQQRQECKVQGGKGARGMLGRNKGQRSLESSAKTLPSSKNHSHM